MVLIKECFVFKMVIIVQLLNHVLLGILASPLRNQIPCKQVIVNRGFSTLECSVGVGQYLDYRSIRTVTSSTKGIKYNVTITCTGGRIYLPWPFRASHVTVLNVKNCGTDGFLAEYRNVPDLPNELEILSFENMRVKIEIKDLYSVLSNIHKVSKKNECGQFNARKLRYLNIEYEFGFDMTSSEDMLLLDQLISTDALKRDFLRTGGSCVFPNLEYLEESGSRSVSSIHFKLIESSFYPKLKQYVISNNSLSRVPQELRNLNLVFLPNIEKLDLSFNSITELSFIYPAPFSTSKDLYVDLRGNKINQLNSATVTLSVLSNGIVFDLRDNPLECSCSLSDYGHYLTGQRRAVALDIFNGMICWSLENGQRKLYNISETNFEKKFCAV